jgi:hypothetical protein
MNFLSGLSLNGDHRDFCLPSSEDYRCEPLHLVLFPKFLVQMQLQDCLCDNE